MLVLFFLLYGQLFAFFVTADTVKRKEAKIEATRLFCEPVNTVR